MFDRDNLENLTETIIYVNLLLAILAVIALYDRRRLDDEDDEDEKKHDRELSDKIDELYKKIARLEERIESLASDLDAARSVGPTA